MKILRTTEARLKKARAFVDGIHKKNRRRVSESLGGAETIVEETETQAGVDGFEEERDGLGVSDPTIRSALQFVEPPVKPA